MIDTAGQYSLFPDMCPHCQMSTGGLHEFGCSNYGRDMLQEALDSLKGETVKGIWRGACHSCNGVSSVVGRIGEDGLCDWCRKSGRTAWW
ncbi:MAG: hypothetical protein DDT33_01678 [Firmicutes bacterium]|nr:hypothetical protein [Bacillota bacterium]